MCADHLKGSQTICSHLRTVGIFQQAIRKETGEQIELPDPWLESANPWEIPRLDTAIEIRFYGEATRTSAGKNT